MGYGALGLNFGAHEQSQCSHPLLCWGLAEITASDLRMGLESGGGGGGVLELVGENEHEDKNQ